MATYFSMVKESKCESNDLSRLTYNLEDKMIFQQFEGAAAPAKYLCLFLHDKKYTWSYVLFTIRVILKQTKSETFAIVADTSHMDHTVDLCKRRYKTILVKKEGAQIDPEVESNYVRVEMMHPSIAKYRSLYEDDLSQCLGLNETRLKPELTFSVLLNALYGLQKRIVGAKLITAKQYSRTKSGKFPCLHVSSSATAMSFSIKICPFYHVSALIQEMQDYLDAKHPSLCVDSDEGNSNDSSSTDGYLAEKTKCNYNKAEEEFNVLIIQT
jgi:hypothetical protein